MELFNLKKFREATGLSQEGFAMQMGVEQPIISKMEKGNKNVSDKLLLKIEEIYGIDLDAFKKYEKNKKKIAVSNGLNTVDEHRHLHEVNNHVQQYDQLLAEKAKLDEHYYAPNKKHETGNLELELLRENNQLLKEIVAKTNELLLRTLPKVK